MCHRLEISGGIVSVQLGIIAQGLKVALLRRADKGIVAVIAVRRRKREGGLADVLAAGRLDQPVERIVDMVGGGIDLLIGVEDGLQRCVANMVMLPTGS
jgi:hypothetical protein